MHPADPCICFAFVQTLTRAFVLPSAVGGVAVLAGLYYGTTDNPFAPAYSVFILLWMAGVCKGWRREEARLACRWNMDDYESAERERSAFKGPLCRGFYSEEGYFVDVDEDDRLAAAAPYSRRFTPAQRAPRVALSYAVILPLVFGVMCGVVAVLGFRSFMQVSLSAAHRILLLQRHFELDFEPSPDGMPHVDGEDGRSHLRLDSTYAATIGSVIGGACNSLFISVTNYGYAIVAARLNDWENHRTPTEHEDALIVKTFCFQFINSYISLFYVAFIKAAQLEVRASPSARPRPAGPSPQRRPHPLAVTPPRAPPRASSRPPPLSAHAGAAHLHPPLRALIAS